MALNLEKNHSLDSAEIISRLTEELVSNPDVLAAYGRKLDSMVQHESGFIQYLPRCVKRRLKAIKKLQLEVFKVEESFYKRVHQLESQYSLLHQPILNTRKEITSGVREPDPEEYDYPSDYEDEVNKRTAIKNRREGENVSKKKKSSGFGRSWALPFTEKTIGIPEFWLTIFKNVSVLNDMIQKHDLPVLAKLQDIRSEYFKKNSEIGFELIFDFGENEYFEEKELRKKYKLRLGPDPDDQMGYEGPEIIASSPFPIHWKKDKNVTLKTKRVKRGAKRFVNKSVKTDSFFNFFNPLKPNVSDEVDDADRMEDFEVGQVVKDNIIPRALLYYTGLAFKDEDEDDDDGSSNSDVDSKKRKKGKNSKRSETDRDTTASSEDS